MVAHTGTHAHTHHGDKQSTEKAGLDVLDLVRCKAEQNSSMSRLRAHTHIHHPAPRHHLQACSNNLLHCQQHQMRHHRSPELAKCTIHDGHDRAVQSSEPSGLKRSLQGLHCGPHLDAVKPATHTPRHPRTQGHAHTTVSVQGACGQRRGVDTLATFAGPSHSKSRKFCAERAPSQTVPLGGLC